MAALRQPQRLSARVGGGVVRIDEQGGALLRSVREQRVVQGVRDTSAHPVGHHHDLGECKGPPARLVGETGLRLGVQAGPPAGIGCQRPAPGLANGLISVTCDHQLELRPGAVRTEPLHERIGRMKVLGTALLC